MAAEAITVRAGASVRALMPQDVPAVSAILKGAPEAASWSERSISEAVAREGVLMLVSEFNREVTGFLMGRSTSDEAEILNIAVAPERRRQGDGRALLEVALAEFRSRGVKRVVLEVRESNENAIAFYAKHGFSKVGRRPGYYREPEEAALLLEKIFTA